jgi:hypothetical protein
MKTLSAVPLRNGIAFLLSVISLALSADRAVASSWTTGQKTLIYIRIDFSDLQGDPVSSQDLVVILSKTEAFFRENSYGLLTIKSVFTPTLRMPRTASFYESEKDQKELIRDARDGAKKAGYDTTQYTLDIVAYRTLSHGGGAEVATVGGKGARILDNFRYGITIHAIGHNLGLPHSCFWQADDGSIIGPGRSLPYGDWYDPMGGGGNADALRNHFVIRSKAILGWLGPYGLTNVTSSGQYRVFPQDVATSGPRGLHIIRDSKYEYWLEFRQLIKENPKMMNGVRIMRSYKYNNEEDLLNMNPNSPEGVGDAPLVIGHTFSDMEAGIYITPFRINCTNPPSIDVFVNVKTFPPDRRLRLGMRASAQAVGNGESVDFEADAGSSDLAPLLYSWDFGDGTFDCGRAKVRHFWKESDRNYVVHSLVTDMAGHSAQRSIVVTVGCPTDAIVTGTIDSGSEPLSGARVNIAPADSAPNELMRDTSLIGLDSTLTDDDGKFSLVGLSRQLYTIRVYKPGYFILPQQVDIPTSMPLRFGATRIEGGRTDRAPSKTALLHVHATIDGTDELSITNTQARWRHLEWNWPSNVRLNNISMDPHVTLANSGSTSFLDPLAKLQSAAILKKSGRGSIDMVLRDGMLVIRFDDPQPGSADYDLDVEFER